MSLCLVAALDTDTCEPVARALDAEFDRVVEVGFAALLVAVARRRPDVVVMVADPTPGDGSSPGWIAVLGELRAAAPPLAVLLCGPPQLERPAEPRLAATALAHGARGYLHPSTDTAALPLGTAQPPPPTGLSHRELQVLQGMTDGLSNAEIAAALSLADDTVKTHAHRLFRKLGAHDRAHAVARGFRHHLLR